MTNKRVDNPIALISWDERGFVRVECKAGVKIGKEEAEMFNQARSSISPLKKHLCFMDASQVSYISRGSRSLAAGKETDNITIAFAIFISSPIGRVLGNFFIQVDKPPYPTKLFTDEDQAIKWLLEFKSIPLEEGKG